jgi:hypothetical protein
MSTIKRSIDYVREASDGDFGEPEFEKHLANVWGHCTAKLNDELESLASLEREQRWQLDETIKRKAELLKNWRAGNWNAIDAVFTSDEIDVLCEIGGMEQDAP